MTLRPVLVSKTREARVANKPPQFTAEELEKVRRLKGEHTGGKVPFEDVLEAEFLTKFGFEAYWAIWPEKDRSRGIGIDEMMRLLQASKKVDAHSVYNASQASFIGSVSAQAKKPSNAFKTATKGIIKEMKAE